MLTYKDLYDIKFPIYPIPSDNWHRVDKILFLDRQVLDDRSVPGKTLGIRRLQCGRRDLLPLTKSIHGIPQLLRCKNKHFIDNNGRVFTYLKTLKTPLKTHKIKRIELKDSASLLWVDGISRPFTIERPPLNEPEYVRFLYLKGQPWLLYDYVRVPPKDTHRRV